MSVRVRIATTSAELDALLRLRHRVYVDEEGYFQQQRDGRIVDRFDAYPTTAHITAVVDGRMVGTVRVAEQSQVGNSTDDFFDFRQYLPPQVTKVCTGGMLCVERAYRSTPRLVFALVGMAYFWGLSRGMTHLVAAINPDVEAFFAKAGATRLAPPVRQNELGLDAVPMMIEFDRLPGGYPAFLKHQAIVHFLDSFEREFVEPGETIIRQGERGHAIYVILDGHVAVERQRSRGVIRVIDLGRGELFGELGLLTQRPVTADAVALTAADLMVVERDAFETQLRDDPNVASGILAVLADRLAARTEALD